MAQRIIRKGDDKMFKLRIGGNGYLTKDYAIVNKGKFWCSSPDADGASVVSHMEYTKLRHEESGKGLHLKRRFILCEV
jgi:hypothetical protein